jgi:hypothetical protein
MVIDDFNFMRITVNKTETYPPLSVDCDGMLSASFSFECMQPVSGRKAKIVQPRRGIEHIQFPERTADDLRGKHSGSSSDVQVSGFLISERSNHTPM